MFAGEFFEAVHGSWGASEDGFVGKVTLNVGSERRRGFVAPSSSGLRRLALLGFLATFAFVAFEATFSLFGSKRFDLTEGSASFVFLGIGIVLGGELVRGQHNIAGEFGHVPLNIDGPRCGCGAMGHTSNLSCYIHEMDEAGGITFDNHAAGCGICVDVCPAHSKQIVKHRAINMEPRAPHADRERENFTHFLGIPEADD